MVVRNGFVTRGKSRTKTGRARLESVKTNENMWVTEQKRNMAAKSTSRYKAMGGGGHRDY